MLTKGRVIAAIRTVCIVGCCCKCGLIHIDVNGLFHDVVIHKIGRSKCYLQVLVRTGIELRPQSWVVRCVPGERFQLH